LDEREERAREFAAAAAALNDLLDECFAQDVPPELKFQLFEHRLGEATYELEPDEGDAILADGWLELPFLDADEVTIAGFAEGKVPESVVGHAFLPDALRRELGLADNASRLARDRTILAMTLACRRTACVTVRFHSVDEKGDVLKPSRLLFDCADDAEFVRRAVALYAVRAGTGETVAADLPAAWRLHLPTPAEHTKLERTSPSGLDAYLRCPFTYLLRKTFGESEDYRAEELDASEFGNLVHEALETWGKGAHRDSTDAEAIASTLSDAVDALLAERFGADVPAIVSLQALSAKRRLRRFAALQARRAEQGWRVVETERRMKVVYGHTVVNGRCDRIDFNERTGAWCVVDYKTWDSAARAVAFETTSSASRVWKSLQLPLYCAMLDADAAFPSARREQITACYCILAKTAEETKYTEPFTGADVPDAEAKIRELVDRIERGIFWPPADVPASAAEWRFDFADWIFNSPAESVDAAWLADQERRLAALAPFDEKRTESALT
ncbi:MAG: PD-(D/E)XK nuclease family protein, partial [Kiritimatiellae bacterium]|nr:PD-(D/E)XK nuclease family protein [Kiritimatiellia bacterium]